MKRLPPIIDTVKATLTDATGPTFVTDANVILEALAAELSEAFVAEAITRQGLAGYAYVSSFRHLRTEAQGRRINRTAA